MHIPDPFRETDPAEISAVMAGAPLAAVVAQTDAGLVANHLPLLAGPKGQEVIGHVALANDMHRALREGQEVLAIFRGEDAYVSPQMYPTKAQHHRHVPTWNYQVVHLYGRISFQHDMQAKRAAVGLLTRLHERRVNGAQGWRMADAPADYMEGMLAAIVALRIEVTRVLAKSKLSQNREAADRAGVREAMGAQGKAALAARMAPGDGAGA